MRKYMLLFAAVIFVNIVTNTIFQYLITKNKIKPNKVSNLFYKDDKTFIKSWEKAKERGKIGKIGMLMYIYKDVILYLIVTACYFWANYSIENRLTWFVLLVIYVIFFLLFHGNMWNANAGEAIYRKLKEKEKIQNDNINNTNIKE